MKPPNAPQMKGVYPGSELDRKARLGQTVLKTRHNGLHSDPAKIRAWKQRTAKQLPKFGKKGKAWNGTRASLKVRFKNADITTCEIKFAEVCWNNNALGFAHSRKRRNITTKAQEEEVCLSCDMCHDVIEAWPESRMERFVKEIIARRSPEQKACIEGRSQ